MRQPRAAAPFDLSGNLVLELAFATKALRSECEDAACAEAAYGSVVAEALVGRLADLRAAGHPLELPFAYAQPATGSDPEHVVVTLAAGRSLVVAANHTKALPRNENGTLAWEHVNRIIVLRLD